MKRLVPIIGATLLFICTITVTSVYINKEIHARKTELIYFNSDERNFCVEGMKNVLSETSIPVFGSSELSAFDDIAYPQSLFQNGSSDFNMVLIGRGYTQSLHHAVNIGAMAPYIKSKKAVLILSPQWFTPEHLTSDIYASRFSEGMYSAFLKNENISKPTTESITNRVKKLLEADPQQLKRIEKYEDIFLQHTLNIAKRIEVQIYDNFMMFKQRCSLAKIANQLSVNNNPPVEAETINFSELMEQALETGKTSCTNNDLYIYDEYYDTYIREQQEEKKLSASSYSYLDSPEYDDLKLFLNVCNEAGIEPLIVSIPVNGWWYDWTGFPKENRERYYQNIRDICEEYQVELCDFSDKEYEAYFLKDVMHLGWKGWVYLDEAVFNFYNKDQE